MKAKEMFEQALKNQRRAGRNPDAFNLGLSTRVFNCLYRAGYGIGEYPNPRTLDIERIKTDVLSGAIFAHRHSGIGIGTVKEICEWLENK